jgi:hypothetical protein
MSKADKCSLPVHIVLFFLELDSLLADFGGVKTDQYGSLCRLLVENCPIEKDQVLAKRFIVQSWLAELRLNLLIIDHELHLFNIAHRA